MAEVILSPLLKVAVGSLGSMIKDEVCLVWGVKQELKNLESTLSMIRDVLEDAEHKQVKEKGVRNWLKELKDVAYEVDNVLDEYATEALREKAEDTTESCNIQVINFLLCICFKKVFFRLSIGHKITELNDRLNKIAKERGSYNLTVGISEKKIENRETHSFVDEKTVLGRESEKKKIVDLLLSSSDDRDDVFVIPIVGLGGLGKTTLAKLVYNDEEIKKHFQLRMWVCVSEEFEIKRLVKLMIESATRKDCKRQNLDLLQDELRNQMSGKRFLLVLDDVWNEDQGKWERLKPLLRGGEKGSRIIVTTRNQKVSEIMGTTSSTQLKGLSDDECWHLIRKRAFNERIEGVPRNLEKIGMEIAKKCKGVPLAAETLGSLLWRFKREESEWLQIRDSETWSYLLKENEEDNILNVLRISYDHLPSHLKQCFTYCSLYPKDYEMKKDELIQRWMAQGFIQQPLEESSGRELEDIGSDYINDLLWGSFFQDEGRDYFHNVTYKMHDLMHDLAQSIAKDECRSIQNGKAEEVIEHNKPYHLSLLNDGLVVPQTILDIVYKCSYLRTLLVFNPSFYSNIVEVLDELFLKLMCLRVLDLSSCGISKLPDSIGNLKHLRYLNLSGNSTIQSLPETICNLWNLQTLDLSSCKISKLPDSIGNLKHLRYLNLSHNDLIQSLPETICNLCLQTLDISRCRGISKLPKRMKNMVSLRHLEMNDTSIMYMPSGIGRLTCLQALSVYRVGKEESGCGGLGELQHMINLRGKLLIVELENAKNIEEAKKASLSGKQHLHTLTLYWRWDRGQVNAQEEEGVLEALQPHPNLRHLSVEFYGGSKFPSWMGNSSFTNLVSISLWGFKFISCECLPSFGKLRHLKELKINKVYGVKYFSTTDGSNYDNEENTLGFPSLEKLELNEMPDLEDLSAGVEGNLSFLHELVIWDCPKLRALPELPSLERLELYKMPNLEDLPAGVEGNLSCLHELVISNCPKLRALPELPSLERLELNEMPNLEDLSVGVEGNLSFLLELDIRNYPKLRALPKLPLLKKLRLYEMPNLEDLSAGVEGNLSCLHELFIENCPKLRALPELPSLEKLGLYETPNLEEWSALPNLKIFGLSSLDEIALTREHLPSLESLSIRRCLNITSLPGSIENLSTLKELVISNCPKLGSLPEGLKHLHALKVIRIYECPLLIEWWWVRREDWPDIVHVAGSDIDYWLF